jgi:hypothetical protein
LFFIFFSPGFISEENSTWAGNWYEGGKIWSDHNVESFLPLFYEEINWNDIDITEAEAKIACTDKTENAEPRKTCMYDTFLTGSTAFGEATGTGGFQDHAAIGTFRVRH